MNRIVAATVVAIAGFATAALMGVAGAKTFTLQMATNAKVVDATTGATTNENIATTSSGLAVYDLTGDSRRHPKCTKAGGCFKVWRPVTVSSPKKLSAAPGVRGRLGTWHRNGSFQVTLSGHPLYTFASDSRKRAAGGEGIRSFHGTWHVIKAAGSSGSGSDTMTNGTTTDTMTTGTTTQTTTSTTPTNPCPYPPYC